MCARPLPSLGPLIRRLLVAGLLLAALSRPAALVPAAQAGFAGMFRVTSTADTNTSDEALTLREALLIARGGTAAHGLGRALSAEEKALLEGCGFAGNFINSFCGQGFRDTILFSPTLGVSPTVPVITVASPLPAITDTETILDGPATGVFPLVVAGFTTPTLDLLTITSNNNVVRGVSFTGSPRDNVRLTGSSNYLGVGVSVRDAGRHGVHIDGGDFNLVEHAYIGVAAPADSCGAGNAMQGILLDNFALSNTVRLSVIACNAVAGLGLRGFSAYNQVLSNTVRHNGNGLDLAGGAHHNQIGAPGAGNLVSANTFTGLNLLGADTSHNLVYANRIGTNVLGTGAQPNGFLGLVISSGAHDNRVGEALSTAHRNLISGNAHGGLLITNGATANYIESNHIGLDAAGTGTIPNTGPGIAIVSADGNFVGSTPSGAPLYIGGNAGAGIVIQLGDSNWIGLPTHLGVAADGTTPAGNQGPGVWLSDAANNVVAPALIAYNTGAGVAVTGDKSLNNAVVLDTAAYNGSLPVDLGDDGHTPNDPGDADSGPNGLLNFPVITSESGGVVSGTACPGCTVVIYRTLGSATAPGAVVERVHITAADGAGHWSYTLPAGLSRWDLSLMACTGACAPGSSTSEFSPGARIFLPVMGR